MSNTKEPDLKLRVQQATSSGECPFCAKELRSKLAKQCRFCGADWHDSNDLNKRQRWGGFEDTHLILAIIAIGVCIVAGLLDYQVYVGFATQSRLKARGANIEGLFSNRQCVEYLKSGLIRCSVDYRFTVNGNSYTGSGETEGAPGSIVYDTANPNWNALSNESYRNLGYYVFIGIFATLVGACFIILFILFSYLAIAPKLKRNLRSTF